MNFLFLHASSLVVPSNLISFEHAWPFFLFHLIRHLKMLLHRCWRIPQGNSRMFGLNLSRSLQGRGLFVNLGALGIQRGCFQDDCSHSDHFEATTPAECAKICKKSLGAENRGGGST